MSGWTPRMAKMLTGHAQAVRCVACGDYKCPSRTVKSPRGHVCLHCARLKAAA